MRTSLNEIKQVEDYLSGNLSASEELLLQASMLINPQLRENLGSQQESYLLIQAYGRKKLRQEIESVHQILFEEKEHQNFKDRMLSFFGRK